MIRNCTGLIILCLFVLTGCVTPAPIKQALVDVDEGYVENLKLMQQYRKLVENINERHRFYHRFTQQRLILDLALRSMTQDHWSRKTVMFEGEQIELTKEENVDDTVNFFGDDLLKIVNELRFPGLTEQKGSDGTMKFEAGKPSNTIGKIVARLPEIVNLITEKEKKDYKKKKIDKENMSAFNTYRTNVSALRQINGTIKRYLDIDVAISPKDISEIANSIRQLQQ